MKLRRSKASGGVRAASTKKAAKALRKAEKAAKDAQKDAEKAQRELVTPKNAKKAIAVGKVLAPVLVPIAVQFAGTARGVWDEHKARRLGVPAGELSRYTGKGGALHARISRVAASMNELSAGTGGGANGHRSADVERFVTANTTRLADLSAAVRAAEMMPTERRRAAHRAVAGELDQIEPDLLALLGVGPTEGHRPPA
jgi:hypothetical protein